MDGNPAKVKFGAFEFDFEMQELRKRGLRVRVPVSQIRLLTLFLEKPGAVLTRDEIAERLWKDTHHIDVANNINTAVNRLRSNLQDDPAKPRYIETLVGAGYRFVAKVQEAGPEVDGMNRRASDRQAGAVTLAAPVADVRPAPEIADGAEHPSPEETEEPDKIDPPLPARRHLRRRAWMLGAVSIALVSLLAALAWRFALRQRALPAPAVYRGLTFNDSDDKVTAGAIAPSGEMIAYSDRSGVSVIWSDSETTRLLASPQQFQVNRIDWYPDGTRLAVSGISTVSDQPAVWQLFLAGAQPRLLVDGAALATIAPDGKSMAFTRDQGTEIDVAAADGSHPRKLAAAKEKQTYRFLLWSRSGRYLIDESAGEGSATPVMRSATPLVDLEARDNWRYETLDATSGKTLARQENVHFDSGFLLNDGQLFYPDSTVSKVEARTRVMVLRTDPSNGRILSSPQVVQSLPGDQAKSFTSSIDGKRTSLVIDRSTADVFVGRLHRPGMALDSGMQISHRSAESYPHAWTRHDDAVLVENNNLHKDAVFELPLDGSPAKLMAQLPNDAAMAEFAPDDKWILFLQLGGRPSRSQGIFRVPVGGGSPEQVPTTGPIDEFHCPSGTKGTCVLREAFNEKVYVYYALDPLKGMGRELARTPWEAGLLGEWSLAPDGSSVAVADRSTFHPGIRLIDLKDAPGKINEIPVEGYGTVLGVTWDVTGDRFFVECKTEAGYNLVYADRKGQAKALRTSFAPIWAVPSHDGSKLAFPEVTFRSQLMLGKVVPVQSETDAQTVCLRQGC
jgi:DNA-binding winged helix-turn-helix (wHTH) protein/dipeptidyl aminopeptidase/acylaminoacyl peptidase